MDEDAWFLSEYFDMEYAIQYREAHMQYEAYIRGFRDLTIERLIAAKGFAAWHHQT